MKNMYVPKVAQKDKLGHKIKLKKRLSKALAATGEQPVSTRPTTTVHQEHRPNPLQRAQRAQQEAIEARAEAQEQREREIQDRRRAAAQAREARRKERRMVTQRTARGQPRMAGQMERLLGKIQKSLQPK